MSLSECHSCGKKFPDDQMDDWTICRGRLKAEDAAMSAAQDAVDEDRINRDKSGDEGGGATE